MRNCGCLVTVLSQYARPLVLGCNTPTLGTDGSHGTYTQARLDKQSGFVYNYIGQLVQLRKRPFATIANNITLYCYASIKQH